MNEYTYKVKTFGNYAELRREVRTDKGIIVQPTVNFPFKKAAMESGRAWKKEKEKEKEKEEAAYEQ